MNFQPINPQRGRPAAMALCALVICAAPTLANRPPPDNLRRPEPPRPVAVLSPVRVLVQKNGAPMRIEIPRNLLGPGAKVLSGATNSTTGASDRSSVVRTVIAGGALSMALAFGGLWFARRRSDGRPDLPRTKTVGLVIGIGLLGGLIASVVEADIAPPVVLPPPPAPTLKSQVKVIARGNEIRIHLSEKQIKALQAEWAKTARLRKAR